MGKWTLADMPSQKGKIAVVTGTGGLGYEDALALARAGADVLLAGRNAVKGAEAIENIRRDVPGASIQFEQLDLASLKSVRAFCERMRAGHDRLDILINNAGVMVPQQRQVTEDGFELQFGTNYLGHFGLTAGLLPLLRQTPGARVISLSSIMARNGKINFDDPQFAERYMPTAAYSQSKIACLMFALELQRRSVAAGWGITSIAAHPGVARTDLLHNAPGRMSLMGLSRTYLWFLFQPVAQGALPTLYAATAPDAEAGGYYGPDGLGEIRGYPAPSKVPTRALDDNAARRLWELSEELTGLAFE